MSKVIKPMLASKADLTKIKYPVLGTPKLDGIRCLVVEGEAKSRNMKPIPNDFVRKELADLTDLDGELMVKGDFNAVSSAIMKKTGEPDFVFNVFDTVTEGSYAERMWDLEMYLSHDRCVAILPVEIRNEEELLFYLEKYLAEGYEGLMIRDPKGPYKHGRSTVNEGYLLKIKKFFDAEGTLIHFNEKMTNNNAKEKDELGRTKRSGHKANLTPAGTAGSATISWNGKEFNVGFGPGIDDAQKQEWWDEYEDLESTQVKFSYQELSKDGIPRFGKMLGFRHEDDL